MRRLVTISFALFLIPSLAALAQTPAARSTSDVAVQLSLIHQSLEEIRQLLQQDVESRELDLLFRRSEFASSRKREVEEQLRSAQGEYRGIEEHRNALVASQESMLKRVESGDLQVDDVQSQIYVDQMENQLARTEERLRDLANEVSRLEGELVTRDRDLEEWQDLLDRMLPKP